MLAGPDEPNLEELIDKVVECVTSAVKEEDVSCIVNTVLEGKGSFHRLLTIPRRRENMFSRRLRGGFLVTALGEMP